MHAVARLDVLHIGDYISEFAVYFFTPDQNIVLLLLVYYNVNLTANVFVKTSNLPSPT